jgi:hypothetical protein
LGGRRYDARITPKKYGVANVAFPQSEEQEDDSIG